MDSVGKDKIKKHENKLNKIASEGIEKIKGIKIIGPPKVEDRAGILSFTLEDLHNHSIALMLDKFNVMVRSGQHCVHSWFNSHKIEGSVRASFYLYNTEEEVLFFIEKLKEISKLR